MILLECIDRHVVVSQRKRGAKTEVMSKSTSDTSLEFVALGGGNEVGRSCHIIRYRGKTVMLDAGIHPAYEGMASLPFYDEFDLSTVDVLLISHFHLDHAASLPYVMQRTNFKGRVFMTHPTKAIYRWLLRDFVRVTSVGVNGLSGGKEESLYTDDDLVESFDRIETIDYHSEMDVDGIKFTAFHAGHVLGAAMFQIEIAGLRVLFTGDYSREMDRHLNAAEVPPVASDVLIVESTFGTATHEPRLSREKKLTQLIHSTVLNNGRVLMPVFALGRAQELMLILDEYWSRFPEELGNGQVPIYYASDLARRCMNVFQTYVNMMNDDIRKKFRDSQTNPFIFKNISYLKNLDEFQDFGPCVMLASPGMLQSGISRNLLEKWCPDEKNLVLVTGYSIEGTMAKYIMLEPETIPSINNPEVTIPRRCQVEEISFAAHVDFQENLEFINKVNPTNIILVHGESNPMGRLKSALLSNFSSLKGTANEVHVYNPRNGVTVELEYKGTKIAKAMGNIIDEIQTQIRDVGLPETEIDSDTKTEQGGDKVDGSQDHRDGKVKTPQGEGGGEDVVVSGILVSDDRNFDISLVCLSDLREYHTELSTTTLRERQVVRVNCRQELVYWHIVQMFGDVDVIQDDGNVTNQLKREDEEDELPSHTEKDRSTGDKLVIQIMGNIRLTVVDDLATVEWSQSLISDTVADAVMTILMSVDCSPASVKLTSKPSDHTHSDTENSISRVEEQQQETWKIKQIVNLFREQFGQAFELAYEESSSATKFGDQVTGKVKVGKNEVQINFSSMKVTESNSIPLKGRVESILSIGAGLVASLC